MTINKQLYCWWLLDASVVEEENGANKSQIVYQKPMKPVPYYADKIILDYRMHLRKQNNCMADSGGSAV